MKKLAPCWRCGSRRVVFTNDERRIPLCGDCAVRLETPDQRPKCANCGQTATMELGGFRTKVHLCSSCAYPEKELAQ